MCCPGRLRQTCTFTPLLLSSALCRMLCSGCNASLACTVILLVLQHCTSAQQHVGGTSTGGVRTWRAAREAAGLAQRDGAGSGHVHTQSGGCSAASRGTAAQNNCRPQVVASIEQQSMPEGLKDAMQATASLPPSEQGSSAPPDSSKAAASKSQTSHEQAHDIKQASPQQPGWHLVWLLLTHVLCVLWGYVLGRWRNSARNPPTPSNSTAGTKVMVPKLPLPNLTDHSSSAVQQTSSTSLASHADRLGVQPATDATSAACISTTQPDTAVPHVGASRSGERTHLSNGTSTSTSDAEADSRLQGNSQPAVNSSNATGAQSQERLTSEALQQVPRGEAPHGVADEPAVAAVIDQANEASSPSACAVSYNCEQVTEQTAQLQQSEYHETQQLHQHPPLLLASGGSAPSNTLQQGDMQLQTVLHAASSTVQLVQADTTHPQGISLHISADALDRCLEIVGKFTRPLTDLAEDVRHAGVLLKQLSQQVAGSMQLLDRASGYMGHLVNLHHQHSQQALCARCIQLGLVIMTVCLLWASWQHGRLATLAIVCSHPATSSSTSRWMSALLRPSTSLTWFMTGVRQLACYMQQMGAYGTGMTVLYLTWPLLYSMTGRQLASSWQVDIPVVLVGLAGAMGAAVVQFLGGCWSVWLMLWWMWCGVAWLMCSTVLSTRLAAALAQAVVLVLVLPLLAGTAPWWPEVVHVHVAVTTMLAGYMPAPVQALFSALPPAGL